MAANKITNKQYKERLKIARQYFNFSFDARNKMTPGRKAAITRAYNTVQWAKSHNLEFVKANKGKKQKLAADVPKEFKTGKGVFIHKFRNADKVFFTKDAIVTKIGVWTFKFYPLKDDQIINFLNNPEKYIAELPDYKKADSIRINVGEFNYTGTQAYQPEMFYRYVKNDLIDNYEADPDEYVSGITLCFLDRGAQNGPQK